MGKANLGADALSMVSMDISQKSASPPILADPVRPAQGSQVDERKPME
jgi:hypothetical protein